MAEPSSSQNDPCNRKTEDVEHESKPETLPHQEVRSLILVVQYCGQDIWIIAVHSESL